MKFLVLDLGLFVEEANALSDNGKNKVYYYTPWQTAFPKFQDYAIGKDFEHLEKILYFFDYIEEADCIVNFDVHFNDLIVFLKKQYPDKSIFGSGIGEMLENERWSLKQMLSEINLPVQETVKITGLSALKEYIKENPNKYIKFDIFRHDISSFHAKDYKSSELLFDEIASMLGPFKEDYDFIVEDYIDTDVEPGVDTFFWGEDYVSPIIYGYEYSKACYLGKVCEKFEDLPYPLKETLEKLRPVLKEMDYRGALSTEEKVLSEKEHYFLDFCARLPNPLGHLYPVIIKNWPEVIYKIGLKQSVKLDIPYKYVGAVPIHCSHAEKNWVKLIVDKKDREYIRFISVAGSSNKEYFAVKGNPTVAVVVYGGNSIEEVVDNLEKYSEKISGYGLETDTINGLIKIKEIIEKGKKVGINF